MNIMQTETVWRVASARMSTKWGMFDAIGFERDISNDPRRAETALAFVMGDLTEGAPLLRIHSQCFTGEMLGSLRCDCRDQLEMAMQAIEVDCRDFDLPAAIVRDLGIKQVRLLSNNPRK